MKKVWSEYAGRSNRVDGNGTDRPSADIGDSHRDEGATQPEVLSYQQAVNVDPTIMHIKQHGSTPGESHCHHCNRVPEKRESTGLTIHLGMNMIFSSSS